MRVVVAGLALLASILAEGCLLAGAGALLASSGGPSNEKRWFIAGAAAPARGQAVATSLMPGELADQGYGRLGYSVVRYEGGDTGDADKMLRDDAARRGGDLYKVTVYLEEFESTGPSTPAGMSYTPAVGSVGMMTYSGGGAQGHMLRVAVAAVWRQGGAPPPVLPWRGPWRARIADLAARCDADDGEACAKLVEIGARTKNELFTAARLERLAAAYRRGCDRGDGDACARLARATRAGDGVAKDRARADALFAQGCRLGGLDACMAVESERARAVEVRVEVCRRGDAEICASLAQSNAELGARAVALRESACAGGDARSCVVLGDSYTGRLDAIHGAARDPARAGERYARACALGDVEGCVGRAELDEAHGGRAAALALYAEACEERSGRACGDLVWIAEHADSL
jgi:TPR repeat protein